MINDKSIIKKFNKEKLGLLVVFIVGIAIKLTLWNRTPYLSRDSVLYLSQINDLTNKEVSIYYVQSFFRTPFYLHIVKEISSYGFSPLHSALIINIILGSLLPIVIYFISRELFEDRKIAIASCILTLFHPKTNLLSIEVQRDIGYLFFCCLFILFLLQYFRNQTAIKLAAASLCLNLTLFLRIEGFELYPIVALIFILYSIINKSAKYLTDLTLFAFFSCIWFYYSCILIDLEYNKISSFLLRCYSEVDKYIPPFFQSFLPNAIILD